MASPCSLLTLPEGEVMVTLKVLDMVDTVEEDPEPGSGIQRLS